MIAFDDALARVEDAARPLPAERVPLDLAGGRVLAEAVEADGDLPPFETTAMDGWAVRAAEAVAGAALRPAGIVGAGRSAASPLAPGEALKVMTGAPLPAGCDAVVPVEEAREEDGSVVVLAPPKPRAHVRARGEVIAKGERLLESGRRLTPADLAVAAAAGCAGLAVARRARAGVLVTGDEVVPAGTALTGARIRNTNGPLLLGALRRAGADARDLGLVGDREEELTASLRAALDSGLDLLLTTGGVSAGDYDLLPGVLRSLGAHVLFHKVSLRPAKPVLVARAGETLVFGLPGNPVSSAVAFDMFVATALRRMSGISPAAPAFLDAALGAPARNKGPRLALHPARVAHEGARLVATPLVTKGSHDLAAHARANALLRLAPESGFETGAIVPAFLACAESTLG